MIQRLIIFLILASTLVACGGKSGKKEETAASFQIFVGAVSDPNLGGGVMVYGREAGGETFAINVTSDALSFPIPNGQWNFYAFGWSGPNILEGTLRCGETTAQLGGGDAVVSFTLSDANCANGNYGNALYKSANQFKPLRLIHCTDISGVVDGTSDCTGVLSGTRSYRVSFETFGAVTSPPLAAACIDEAGAATGITERNLNLPTGGFFVDLLSVKIETFKFPGCTGSTVKTFVLNSGLEANYPDSVLYDDTTHNALFLQAPPEIIIPNVALNPIVGSRINITGGTFSIKSAVEVGIQTQDLTGGTFTFKANREAATGKLRYLENNNLQLNIGTK